MADLIQPHGGVLINRFADDGAALQAAAADLTKVPVSNADLSTVYRISDGALSSSKTSASMPMIR